MGSGWIGMSGGCEVGWVAIEGLRFHPIGSLPAEGPGSEGSRRDGGVPSEASRPPRGKREATDSAVCLALEVPEIQSPHR